MKSKIISASAGTGKTYTIALEYIKTLNSGVKYDEILVITFTKKATFEIKERVFSFLEQLAFKKNSYLELEKSLNMDINRDYLQKVYLEMIKNSENIKIMTNDALINKIFKTTIAPYKNIYGYEIVNENDDEFITKILNNLIEKYFDEFNELYLLNGKKQIEDIKENIKDLLMSRSKIYNLVDKKSEILENKKYSLDLVKEDLLKFLEEYKDINFIKPIGKGTGKDKDIETIFSIKEEIEKIKNINNTNNLLKYFSDFSGNYIKNYYIPKGSLYEIEGKTINNKISDEYKERIANLYLEDEIFKYNKTYRKLAKICFDIEDEIKFNTNKLTFSDISFYTNRYLYEKELNLVNNGFATNNLLELLGGKIHTLMIDEFQDTDPIQLKLFLPIIKTCENILIVGDEKQAIYGFRGADSSLFKNIDKILIKNIKDIEIEKKTLETCYRTRGNIINFINNKFKDFIDFDYEEVKFVKEGGYVKLIEFNKDTKYMSLINELKNNKGNSEAILFRGNKELDEVSKELEKECINYNSIKTMSLIKDKNILSIKSLIDYLVTKNTYNLLEFLRSDLIGMSLNNLKKYIDGNLNDNYIIQGVNKLLEDSTDFKRKFIEYFGYNKDLGNEDILNINKFLDLIDKKRDLNEFYNSYLNITNGINQENSNNEGSINLITMHKSKGLEYDDIHVFYEYKKEDFKDYRLVEEYDEDHNLIDFYYIKKRKIVELTDFGKKYFNIFNNKELEEAKNLIYVALTRPKNNLYIYFKKVKDDFMNFSEEEIGNKYIEEKLENKIEQDIEFNNKDFYLKTSYESKNINSKVNSIETEMIRKLGLAIHYYMENFKTEDDYIYAKSMLLKKYGNLLGPNKINEVITRCNNFIINNKEIFDNKYNIYTEYKIEEGKYVIDRLNIDEKDKVAYIYDYKTIKNPEKIKEYINQIENYKNILEKEMEGYIIKTKLLSI